MVDLFHAKLSPERQGSKSQGVRAEEGNYATTRMTPTLRWTAMRAFSFNATNDLTLRCHHQNHFYTKMDSDESIQGFLRVIHREGQIKSHDN